MTNARKLCSTFPRTDLHHYVFGRQWTVRTPPRHVSKEALALFISRHYEDRALPIEECFVCYGEYGSTTFQCHACAFAMCLKCESSLRLQQKCPQCERSIGNHEVDEFVRNVRSRDKFSLFTRLFSLFFVACGKKKVKGTVKKQVRSKILAVQW